jgi:GxxExxY protein
MFVDWLIQNFKAMNEKTYNELTSLIISACIEVHRELGPGLLESVYEVCLLDELFQRGLKAEAQVRLPVTYKGKQLNKEFIIDILVENMIVVELKTVDVLAPIHEVQLVTYLKISEKKLGLLVNFNVELMKNGIRRKINGNLNG